MNGDYRAPPWLPGGHLQTLYPLLIAGPGAPLRRERWGTPDGDFIDLDWLATPAVIDAPLVVLFHGLEGSSASHYARALMRAVSAYGWRGVVVHFRGCSGEPNRLPRSYHSGDADEIDWVLRRLRGSAPRVFAMGVSLGGNALMKWAGTRSESAAGVTDAVAAISAPLDVTAAGHAMGERRNRIYCNNFLRTMKPVAEEKFRRFPGLFDLARVRAARSLLEFDDAFTAPLHGFKGVHDFWRRASSKPQLTAVRVPALVLNARNDSFVPAQALPTAHDVSSTVTLEQPAEGGHVGFASGAFPGHVNWLPERVLRFFTRGC